MGIGNSLPRRRAPRLHHCFHPWARAFITERVDMEICNKRRGAVGRARSRSISGLSSSILAVSSSASNADGDGVVPACRTCVPRPVSRADRSASSGLPSHGRRVLVVVHGRTCEFTGPPPARRCTWNWIPPVSKECCACQRWNWGYVRRAGSLAPGERAMEKAGGC